MKKFFALMILVLLPSSVLAGEANVTDRPHWSLELKGGRCVPAINEWSTYFQDRDASTYGGSLSYKIIRQVELGVEGRYLRAAGQGNAPLHAANAGKSSFLAGDVLYEAAPLNVFLLARGVLNEDQWLIPYAGGGPTRMFYREEVTGQSVSRGYANGYHARAGIQLVLDQIDPDSAHRMRADYGIYHTSFFIEAERVRALADTSTGAKVDIGGTSWMAGLLFEF